MEQLQLPDTDPPLATAQSGASRAGTRPGHMSAEGTCREAASKVGRNSRTQQNRPEELAKVLKWSQLGNSGSGRTASPLSEPGSQPRFTGALVPREIPLPVTLGQHLTAEGNERQEWDILGSCSYTGDSS